MCSLYASVQGINDSPFLPRRAVHDLQFQFSNSEERQHFLLLPLDCPTAKTGQAVNGGRSPFILTVDWLGWFCYPI
ncbi:MAG: hypothetical protein K1W03_03650, partial [Mailhella sp.]